MALVAYDSSDSEDDDEPESRPTFEGKSKFSQENERKLAETEVSGSTVIENSSTHRSSLFASLPPPRPRPSQTLVPEIDDSKPFLASSDNHTKCSRTKENKPIKIVIPSLSELEEDEPSTKKPRPSAGKGLFSVLPPPKHSSGKVTNRPLIPYSLKSKPATNKLQPLKPNLKEKSSKTASTTSTANESDDDDLDDTHDFFSLESVGKISDAPYAEVEEFIAPIVNDAKHLESASASGSTISFGDYTQEGYGNTCLAPVGPNLEATSSAESSTSSNPYELSSMMADEGFLRLGGIKKRKQEEIQFIDVAQVDQLPSTEEWMRKALKEETGYRPSRKKGFMPTAQQRRKHQITYLAFQAKEREMELQEQWAQNRFARHQTQSKYGF